MLFLFNNQAYVNEMERIHKLEIQIEQDRKRLEDIRKKTIPCDITGLNDPRSCYVNSNYSCRWNTDAERCDMIL